MLRQKTKMLPKASGGLSKRHRSQYDAALTGQRWDNMSIRKKKIKRGSKFPGDPVVKTPHFDCQGPRFDP